MAGAGRATGAGRAMAAGAGRGGGAARAAGAGAAGRAGAAAGAAFLGGSANASPIVAVIIEIARTLAAQPALHRSIVLNSHVNSHVATRCNARAVAWFLRPSYRGTDPWWICVRTIHRPFIVDASPLRQKETRVFKMRLGWNGLEILPGAAHILRQTRTAPATGAKFAAQETAVCSARECMLSCIAPVLAILAGPSPHSTV